MHHGYGWVGRNRQKSWSKPTEVIGQAETDSRAEADRKFKTALI